MQPQLAGNVFGFEGQIGERFAIERQPQRGVGMRQVEVGVELESVAERELAGQLRQAGVVEIEVGGHRQPAVGEVAAASQPLLVDVVALDLAARADAGVDPAIDQRRLDMQPQPAPPVVERSQLAVECNIEPGCQACMEWRRDLVGRLLVERGPFGVAVEREPEGKGLVGKRGRVAAAIQFQRQLVEAESLLRQKEAEMVGVERLADADGCGRKRVVGRAPRSLHRRRKLLAGQQVELQIVLLEVVERQRIELAVERSVEGEREGRPQAAGGIQSRLAGRAGLQIE